MYPISNLESCTICIIAYVQVFVTSVKKSSWQAATATLFAFYSRKCSIFENTSKVIVFPKRAKLSSKMKFSSSALSNPQGNKMRERKNRNFWRSRIFKQQQICFIISVSERVAVKIIDKGKLDGKTQKMVTREINIMDSLSHPNLIRYGPK